MSTTPGSPVLATALAALVAVLLAGCGGSGSAAPTSPLPAGNPVAARQPAAGRDRGARHRHRGHAVTHRAGAAARRASGSTAAFSAVATGSPRALDQLAATVEVSRRFKVVSKAASASPAQFVGSADAICGAYRRTVRSTGARATTLVAQQTELSTLVGETAAALRHLSALVAPAGKQGVLGRFIGLTRSSVGEFVKAQARSGSTRESTGTARETQDLTLARRSARDALGAQAAARQLGLHVCGSQGAEWL